LDVSVALSQDHFFECINDEMMRSMLYEAAQSRGPCRSPGAAG
jgi:hypothetical protein